MDANLNEDAIRTISELTLKGMGPQTVSGGNIPYALVPDGYEAQELDGLIFNEHNKAPERVKGTVKVVDPASFIHYYTLFNDPNSRVFADEATLNVLAVLDYHGAGSDGGPRWGQHRLSLELRTSEEWKTWIGQNNKMVTQQGFAEFLEQNSMDITKPSPASIVEIASDLQATTNVEFAAGLRQADGQVKFRYTETQTTTVGAGQVSVPDRFTISIPAFVGADPVSVEALLRFRTKDGKLTFWYTLVRPGEVIRRAFMASREAIAKDLGITILNGTPAA